MPRYDRRSARGRLLSLTACLFLAWSTASSSHAQTFTSFDGPLAGNQSGGVFQAGTFPVAINRWGGIALVTLDNNGISHGFVREPNGSYVTVHPPHARVTYVAGINASGQVAGSFIDFQAKTHGYIKNTDGSYTQLDATGITNVVGINDAGQVAGNFLSFGVGGSFLWDPAHPDTYTLITVPGSTSFSVAAINASGQIAGNYSDGTSEPGGFLRKTDGTVTTFKIGGASSGTSTQLSVTAMNKFGTVIGGLFDEGLDSGFVRFSGGGHYLYGTGSHEGPQPVAINDSGVIVGHFFSDGGGDVAFTRDRAGTITDIPVPFSNTATDATAISAVGHIVGTYTDSNGVSHGWLE